MFLQNFIRLRAAVHELSCQQRKNSDENKTVHRGAGELGRSKLGLGKLGSGKVGR